jgi:hypothetical protein
MALTEPFNLLQGFPGWTTGFDLKWRQEQSVQASGRVLVKDLGSPLWTLRAASKTLPPNALDYWRARLTAMENGLKQFYGYSMSRCYPILYPRGSWPTGTSFDGTGTLATIGGDRKSVTIGGLPPGFTLSVGDYVSLSDSGTLHQVMEEAAALAGGVTPAFELRPHVPPTLVAGGDAVVGRPSCLMAIVPGSIHSDSQLSGWGTVSFSAMEARL